jgi:hypothetical protein
MIGSEVVKGIRLFPYGVYVDDIDAVIVADLHIGFEQALEESGIHVPVSQFPKVLRAIIRALEGYKPKRLVIAGDVKHEFSRAMVQEWAETLELIRATKELVSEIRVVRGNHDNFLIPILREEDIELDDPVFIKGGIAVAHGHKEVPLKGVRRLFIGHVHPSLSIRGEIGEKVKVRCMALGKIDEVELYVLPALSPYALGYDLLEEERISPFLEYVNTEEFRIIAVDEEAGIFDLGKLGNIKEKYGKVYLGLSDR